MTLLTTIGNQTSHVDATASPGTTYFYAITARNTAGEGPITGTVNATPFTLPISPSGLAVQFGNQYANLTWNAPASNGFSAITNYTIYRGTSVGNQSILTTIGNITHSLIPVCKMGRRITIVSRATNAAGEGPSTTVSSGIPKTSPQPPMSIASLSSDPTIILSWQPPESNGGSPVTGYRIYRGTSQTVKPSSPRWEM